MWCSPRTGLLVSSGDDGLLHLWQPASWGGRSAPAPLRSVDMNKWVSADMRGPPLKLDTGGDKEEKAGKMGSPAAAHSLCGDGGEKVLVGTVCNEIYEVDFSHSSQPPMCYVQSHYDELWGLATHPSRQEFCTTSEDGTLRLWDLGSRTMKAMAKLPGPGRSCAYSADGRLVAVGLGGGGFAKGKPSQHDGQWLLLDAESLQTVASPPHKRKERIACIQFSPDGRLVAVGSADNFVDIYAVQKNVVEFKYECKGHSSFITHLDWSADSQYLQTCCGAYELLYWSMYREGEDGRPRFHPRQMRKSSAMKDVVWHTHSCLFGWPMRGIWPTDSDGTDVNAVARSHSSQLIATADDIGKVKLFSYPCIVPRAHHKAYEGHSSHVTNVAFTESDKCLISAGGNDRALFQWQLVQH